MNSKPQTFKQYPGLAIQQALNLLPVVQWEVIHAASGRVVAKLPSKAAAKTALAPLSKLLDWTQTAESIVPVVAAERSYLLTCIDAIVQRIKRAA